MTRNGKEFMTRKIAMPWQNSKHLRILSIVFIWTSCWLSWGQQKERHIEMLSSRDGLSQSLVTSILQDREGYLWFGTQQGLNRYDGYRFTVYRHEPKNPNTIANDWVHALYEDSSGTLWVGTNGGLSAYNRKEDRFESYLHDPNDNRSLGHDEVTSIDGSHSGRSPVLWLVTSKGVDRFVPGWEGFSHLPQNGDPLTHLPDSDVNAVRTSGDPSRNGFVWIGTSQGLSVYNPRKKTFRHFNTESGLPGKQIKSLFWDHRAPQYVWLGTSRGMARIHIETEKIETYNSHLVDGTPLTDLDVLAITRHNDTGLWLGTDHGAFLWNHHNDTLQEFTYKPEEAKEIRSVLQDQSGVLWMGSVGQGLNRYDLNKERFAHYRHSTKARTSLSNDLIFNIMEDSQERIWLATGAGGVEMFEPENATFTHFNPKAASGQGLAEGWYWSFTEGPSGDIWLGGSATGLFRFRPGTGVIAQYQHDPEKADSLSSSEIRSLYVDRNKQLWVGTKNGLNLLNASTDTFRVFHHDPKDPTSLGHANVMWFQEMGSDFWVATLGGGLNLLDRETGTFKQFRTDPSNEETLGSDEVLVIYGDEDRNNNTLWLGTNGGGLNRFDIATGKVKRYTVGDGLPDNTVGSILADKHGLLWLGTNEGISRFDPDKETFTNYTEEHGLQGPEFSQTAAVLSKSGLMYFGGNNGFNVFNPTQLGQKDEVPPVIFTDFRLFNQSVKAGADQPLTLPIWNPQTIVLNYKLNVFSLEFAALNAASPSAVAYSYKLEGLNEDWIDTSAENRLAVFTNLSQGDYTLRVRARTADSEWRELKDPLKLTILPPPWKTWWAYSLYILFIVSLASYYVSNQRKKLAFERAVNERQNAVNERLRQVDKFKDEILANTSHELRTPLHGIIGLADSLRDGSAGKLPDKAKRNLDMIIFSGKRLTSLVNDILDFSKLKTKKLELQKTPVDLYTLAEMVLSLSKPLLAGKELELINAIPTNLPPIPADENRLQQILHNLVGNAIKFTEQGFVKISTCLSQANDELTLQVIDTGIGIPEKKIETIFNAFEQADSSAVRSYGGTGLGLPITKHLVALHGGTITVNSVPNKGSIFAFTLPLSDVKTDINDLDFETTAKIHAFSEEEVVQANEFSMPMDGDALAVVPEEPDTDAEKSRILIVDDEPINRQVLINYLGPLGYQLIEAGNGFDALKAVEEDGPFDLVLLDIMMPRMSGYEVCAQIRQSLSVNELPIIFLTAKNQAEDLVEGFASGANDYLTKPITKSELLARVRTHLKLRHFHHSLELKVNERTRELRTKNSELDAKYHELETFNNIVKAINRVLELDKVVEILMEQGMVLFPSARAASFAIYNPKKKGFTFIGARGHDTKQFVNVTLTPEDVSLWCEGHPAESKGVLILDSPRTGEVEERLAGLPNPLSQVVMSIPQEGHLTALMTLDNDEREHAFSSLDHAKLLRFREHAVNAVARARVIDDLVGTQNQLVEEANMAGKAEIATNVLHNVGNTLNSVRTSVHMIQENMCEQKWLRLFQKIVELLHTNQDELDRIFTTPARRQTLVSALERIWQNLNNQTVSLGDESRRLVDHVQNIVSVLIEQERHAQYTGNLAKSLSINDVIEETLRMESYLLKHKRLKVDTSLGVVPKVQAEKSKLVRIFFNLLKNSWQAIEEAGHGNGELEITSWQEEDFVWVEVRDNGIGQPNKNLSRVCEQGFSTKKHCEGFGLHYVANAMRDMCGRIRVESPGIGKGFRVLLAFPIAEPLKPSDAEDTLELLTTHTPS